MSINAISSSGAAYTAPVATQSTWTNPAASAALNSLTPDDWQLGAAAAGHPLNQNSQLQPLLLFQIAHARQSGELTPTQPVTVNWLQSQINPTEGQGYISSVENAIAYLKSNPASNSSNPTPTAHWGLDVIA